MFAIRTTLPAGTATSASTLGALSEIWPVFFAASPWIERVGWIVDDDEGIYLVFNRACASLIARLSLLSLTLGREIATDENLGVLSSCFQLVAPFWTQAELLRYITDNSNGGGVVVNAIKLEAAGGANWRLWVRNTVNVDIKDIRVFFSRAHLTIFGSHRVTVRKLPPAAAAATLVIPGMPQGNEIVRWTRAALLDFDEGSKRTAPVDIQAAQSALIVELEERLAVQALELYLAGLKIEECEANHQ